MITDASQVGLGGVLLQEDRPVAFESKKFNSTECNYQTTERELLGTFYCLKKWAVYMRHNPENIIYTDHIPNVYFQTKPNLSAKEIRMMDVFSQFPGKILYKPGRNMMADPLSRMPSFYMGAILRAKNPKQALQENEQQPGVKSTLLQEIRKSYSLDKEFKCEGCILQDGIYYQNGKIFLPNEKDIKNKILEQCHDSEFAGHMGRDKTTDMVHRLFKWKNSTKEIAEYCNQCPVCQLAKNANTKHQGLLHLPHQSERPFADISVDLITCLNDTEAGHNAILVVVDRATKAVILMLTVIELDAAGFAQLMVDHVFTKHGWPLNILSDRDPRFTGKFWEAVCDIWNIHPSLTSAYHPQSDGQTERANRTIEQVLRAHALTNAKEWDKSLSMVEFAMNNSIHASLKYTPFFLNTGRNPLTPMMAEILQEKQAKVSDKCPQAFQFITNRQEALQKAMENIKIARDRYKSYADANRQDIKFQLGQQVVLSTVNLNKHTINRKLFPKFVGPFPITQIVNDVAYRIQLPELWKIHNVFHVSLLKPWIEKCKTHPHYQRR